MGLLIKNGEIITASSRFVADIWCEDDKITRIDQNIEAPVGAEVIDATGKYVFPGFIDPHTHIHLPFMGTYGADDFESGTIAALCGGTTTVFDLAIMARDGEPQDALDLWHSKAEGNACCDYSFHMAVTRWDEDLSEKLEKIAKSGVKSFKVFLGYKGALGVEDDELFNVLKLAKKLDVLVAAHCENAAMIDALQGEFLAEGKTGPEWHEPSRPERVETAGTQHFCDMAELTGARIYIVHLSCEGALRAAMDAKLRGVDVTIETLLVYLLLDKTYAERPNFEGARYVMSPPLRDKRNQDVLWAGIKNRLISTLGTDHAPFNTKQKEMGRGNFAKIPNGIPSVEDRVRLFYTHGVAGGRVDVHTFVDLCSTRAAKTFGLFPRKGTIQVGSDADLVVYDPNYKGTISAKTHHMNVDYSAFEGREVIGRCDAVSVRGQVQVIDGEFVGKKGYGKFLAR